MILKIYRSIKTCLKHSNPKLTANLTLLPKQKKSERGLKKGINNCSRNFPRTIREKVKNERVRYSIV